MLQIFITFGAFKRLPEIIRQYLVFMRKGVRRIVARVMTFTLLAAIVIAGVLAYSHRQAIADHFAAHNFSPSTEVATLTERLALTDAGWRVFLASEPTLEASQHFNDQCAKVDHDDDHHVLGCFVGGKIHLFDIQDERLRGVIETTAAHELLHAVFYRLSASEREDLAELLMGVYETLISEDPTLAERMSVYSHLSERSFANELHSVLGTEVRELPAWLEDHYAQWLSDRLGVVAMFESYQGVFRELREQVEALQQQLNELRRSVEARSDQYEIDAQALNEDVADFQARIEALEFVGDQPAFYAEQGSLLERSRTLEAEYAAIAADIEQYEEMRLELERLGKTSDELGNLLNSQLAPPIAP